MYRHTVKKRQWRSSPTISHWSQFVDRVKWDLEVRELFCRFVHEIGQYAPHYSLQPTQTLYTTCFYKHAIIIGGIHLNNYLMAYDQHIFLSFQLHDNRFKTMHKISVRFTTRVPIVELVLVSKCKFSRIFLLDGFICHCFTITLENCEQSCEKVKKCNRRLFKRTTSSSLSDLHCSTVPVRNWAVWTVRFNWLVHTWNHPNVYAKS